MRLKPKAWRLANFRLDLLDERIGDLALVHLRDSSLAEAFPIKANDDTSKWIAGACGRVVWSEVYSWRPSRLYLWAVLVSRGIFPSLRARFGGESPLPPRNRVLFARKRAPKQPFYWLLLYPALDTLMAGEQDAVSKPIDEFLNLVCVSGVG